MKENKKTNAVALKETNKIPEMLTVLDGKIAELKTITDSVYKTTGNLEGFGDIKAETKIENLIRAFSSVNGRKKAYDEAAAILGLTSHPQFTVSGGTVEDWEQDIKLRIEIITHKDKLDKLNEYKEKMSKFLSEEDQKAMLVNEMTEFFSKF